jgi:hypothetical protein
VRQDLQAAANVDLIFVDLRQLPHSPAEAPMNYDLSAHLSELKARFDNWRRTRPPSHAKNHWAKWLIALSFIFAPIALTIRYSAQSQRLSVSTPQTVYDSNPDHLWNRLHRAFYVRMARNGEEYGHDELDPLLWSETKHLLIAPSHQHAIKLLDEFLSVNGSALVTDPLKRAMLQRDLWAIFDWSEQTSLSYPREAEALQSKLALVIRSIALSREQIQALPDNYVDAVRAKVFAAQYDPERRETAFLPPDLFQPDGPWVCVGARGDQPVAPSHAYAFSGRSVFLIFIRLPEGRSSTLNYLEKLQGFPVFIHGRNPNWRSQNPNLPQFPVGAQLALVRKMVLIDNQGDLVPTRLTEDVQIRVHRAISKTIPEGFNFDSNAERMAQDFFEIKLSRAKLFAGHSGGLRALARDEKEFLLFMSHGDDPIEWVKENESMERERITTLKFCVNCHFMPGIHSMMSLSGLMDAQSALIASDINNETKVTIGWKQTNQVKYDWRLLQRLWRGRP